MNTPLNDHLPNPMIMKKLSIRTTFYYHHYYYYYYYYYYYNYY